MSKMQFAEFLNNLCQTVRRIRKEKGLSQGAIAERLDKPQSMVARFESGKINDTQIGLIFRMCDAIEEDIGKVVSQAVSATVVNQPAIGSEIEARWIILKERVEMLKGPQKKEIIKILEGIFKLMQ